MCVGKLFSTTAISPFPRWGGGRIVLPLHQMTAKSLFLDMHWGRLARAMMASPPTSTLNPGAPKPTVSPEAVLSAPEAATSNVNLQASSPLCQSTNVSDPPMAQAMGANRLTQPSQWDRVLDSLITGCRRYDRWRLAGVWNWKHKKLMWGKPRGPIVSFEQPVSSDLPTAWYAAADQLIQPPPPSGGGGPQ